MESKNSEEKFIEIMKELCTISNDKGLTFPNFDYEKCNFYFKYKIIINFCILFLIFYFLYINIKF